MAEKKLKILAIEDNPGVLFNLKMTLEYNNFEVITANNGEEAIEILSKMKDIPDIIISDIMMPKMDGYEFFKYVSGNSKWNLIPFLFLTAKSSPEDVRFGKILGVDDYITKPFEEEDLIAIIKGKISRSKQSEAVRKRFDEKILSFLEIDKKPSISEEEKMSVTLLFLVWDEYSGPVLKDYYPSDQQQSSTLLHQIGIQLFHSSVSIFGQHGAHGSEGTLMNITNIGKTGYVYFDSIEDTEVRGGERLFMLTVLAPKISYYESLRIKEIFCQISKGIKNQTRWDIKEYWEEISNILSSSLFDGENISEIIKT